LEYKVFLDQRLEAIEKTMSYGLFLKGRPFGGNVK